MCPMYGYTVKHDVLLRRPPPGANSLQCYIYIFFFELKRCYEFTTIYMFNLEVKSMSKNGNLDLQEFIKTKMEILNKGFGSTYPCNRLLYRWLGREGKVVTGGCAGVVMEDSHFVLPVLLCW